MEVMDTGDTLLITTKTEENRDITRCEIIFPTTNGNEEVEDLTYTDAEIDVTENEVPPYEVDYLGYELNERKLVLKMPKLPLPIPVAPGIRIIQFSSDTDHDCEHCSRRFQAPELLERHLEAAHADPIYEYNCHFCDKKFTQYWFYKNHLTNNHQGIEITFSCPSCNEQFHTYEKMEEHKLKEHGPPKMFPFKCRHCNVAFESVKEICLLRKHLMESHSDTKEAAAAIFNSQYQEKQNEHILSEYDYYPCRFCKRGFTSDIACEIHILFEHRAVVSCSVCRMKFHSEVDFAAHITLLQHEVNRCKICTKKVKSTADLIEHWDEVHSEIGRHSFYCEVCSLRFVAFTKLLNHYEAHLTEEQSVKVNSAFLLKGAKVIDLVGANGMKIVKLAPRKFQCRLCPLAFTLSGDCNRHISKMHPAEAVTLLPHRCNECGNRYPSSQILKVHVGRAHKNIEPRNDQDQATPSSAAEVPQQQKGFFSFKCKHCPMAFVRQADMFSHIKKQHPNTTNEFLHRCILCLKPFQSFELLISHRQTEHNETTTTNIASVSVQNTNEFVCTICGIVCDTRASLALHTVEHRDLIFCPICGVQMSDQNEVQRHAEIHSTDRRYPCTMCPKKFLKAHHLKNHLLLHEGLKPHSCDVCGKEFALMSNMRSHMKVHEREMLQGI